LINRIIFGERVKSWGFSLCRRTIIYIIRDVGYVGRLAGSFGTATFRVDCTLPLT
jgi:hypothetical protein